MKIYTRTGDDGTTGLIGGSRVRKSDRRIECYGTVDELNASLGLCVVVAQNWLKQLLFPVQNELFIIGSYLAAPENDPSIAKYLPILDHSIVERLEQEIDAADNELPALKNFILPGGTEPAARMHLSRTICRRSERLLVDFSMDNPVNVLTLTYLNRLSDWLFTYARLTNHRAGVADIPWEPRK